MHRFLLAAALLALAPDPAAARDLRPMASDAVRTMTATPRGFGKASPDTIAIYGGPGTPEGKFEDALGQPDWQGWTSVDRTDDGTDKAGDFTKITSGLADLDPCVDNPSPAVNWIDDGSDPNNAPGQSTGGSTSSTWTYTPFVVNYTNGISVLGRPIHNEILSPEIPWELPGTEDDGFGRGAVLEFDVYEHNPLKDGIFYTWRVRSLATGSSVWSDWRDRGFVYFNESPQWKRRQIDITDLIEPDPVKVQIALGIVDLADDLGYPGNDATSGPRFDSMTLKKVNLDGPLVQALQSNIYQDGFPSSGAVFDTLNLISQSIRVDMATNVGTGSQIVPGDSLVVSVAATVPGTSLVRPPQMHWYLETNELFDGVRVLPSGSTLFLPGVWTGTVTGSPVFRETGIPVPNQWYFDLPDGPQLRPGTSDVTELPFFFPGDILTWSVEAVDTDGNTTHFPQEITTNNYSESEECGSSGKFAKPRPPEPKEPIPNEPPSGLPDVWGEAPGFGKNPSLPPGYHQPRILVWDDSDNQDDFAALGVAGMVALVLMLVLLTVQFRSFAQSALIFLAIPFSFLGVFSALTVTDNPLSFLAVVGFIALIGVAVNNTILLVDAANQARRLGATAGDAIGAAVTSRFRPLVTTTITTIAGLLPLSLADPFWESLGFTLIGGLVSSTVLVLVAFPAFYLGLEALRTPVRNAVRSRRGRPLVA